MGQGQGLAECFWVEEQVLWCKNQALHLAFYVKMLLPCLNQMIEPVCSH